MYEEVKKKIKASEGFSNRGYFLEYKGPDGTIITEDFMTIGYGHKVVEGDPYKPYVDYPTEVLEKQFEKDFEVYLHAAERYIGSCEVPEHIKEIIIETAYNIGEPKLFMFKNMRAKMQEGDWQGMAAELRDSKLYRTLTSRYEPLAKIIEET
jgi:GH24 family phage-related lysozyme (muramidase)